MLKAKYYDAVQRLRLIDDIFMTECLKDVACVELVIRIILNRRDIHVEEAVTQEFIRGWGRSLRLDVRSRDDRGRKCNIEIQRGDKGAEIRRSRFHSGVLDYISLEAGQDFSELKDNYVIFITEHDVLKKGLPLYTIERCIMETGEMFNDGSHIIYVNGEYRDENTELGRLMHDFFEPDPDEMFYSELAERTRYFKQSEEEVYKLSGIIDELVQKGRISGFRDGRAEGRAEALAEKEDSFITGLLKLGKLAFSEIAQCAGVSLSRVQDIANSLGIHEP